MDSGVPQPRSYCHFLTMPARATPPPSANEPGIKNNNNVAGRTSFANLLSNKYSPAAVATAKQLFTTNELWFYGSLAVRIRGMLESMDFKGKGGSTPRDGMKIDGCCGRAGKELAPIWFTWSMLIVNPRQRPTMYVFAPV